MRLSLLVAAFFVAVIPQSTLAAVPNCSGTNGWPAGNAYTRLKNAGILEPETTDFTKTRVNRLASEKIGKDLYRQIYEITFVKKAGDVVTVVAVSDASHEECSMGGVKVFVVSQQMGDLKK
jgi:hypothetical protein